MGHRTWRLPNFLTWVRVDIGERHLKVVYIHPVQHAMLRSTTSSPASHICWQCQLRLASPRSAFAQTSSSKHRLVPRLVSRPPRRVLHTTRPVRTTLSDAVCIDCDPGLTKNQDITSRAGNFTGPSSKPDFAGPKRAETHYA
jgi:hypothetical protein